MTSEEKEIIEKTFDSFCKRVIRNAAADYLRGKQNHWKNECAFSTFSMEYLLSIGVEDTYDAEATCFHVLDMLVTIRNPALAAALEELKPDKRLVLLLSYFGDLSNIMIGKQLNLTPRSVSYRKTEGLRNLREILQVGNLDV